MHGLYLCEFSKAPGKMWHPRRIDIVCKQLYNWTEFCSTQTKNLWHQVRIYLTNMVLFPRLLIIIHCDFTELNIAHHKVRAMMHLVRMELTILNKHKFKILFIMKWPCFLLSWVLLDTKLSACVTQSESNSRVIICKLHSQNIRPHQASHLRSYH